MNIWEKLFTALRGGVNDAGEAIIDSQAMRILEQEIRDASHELNESKNGLATLIAQKKLAEEKIATLQTDIKKYEGYIADALQKDDEALAREIAQKVAGLEADLQNGNANKEQLENSIEKLRNSIIQAEGNIKRLKQQIDTVKATETVQKAQEAVAERHSGTNSKLRTAMDSLERMEERQKLKAARLEAATEIEKASDNDALQKKLEDAGIVAKESDAEKILQRIKNKSSK